MTTSRCDVQDTMKWNIDHHFIVFRHRNVLIHIMAKNWNTVLVKDNIAERYGRANNHLIDIV